MIDPISSNLGLKQGCPLSPMLFNLYIDDIKNIFDKKCDPIDIQENDLYHFLYADDLVLLSNSPKGLQNSLDKLAEYAEAKGLTINIKKSKTMTFNLQGRLIKNVFNIKGISLEPVNTFCYLGFEICPSGTVNHAMNSLRDKAGKAARPLMNAIAKFDLPVKTSIQLFHTYVSPILLYNVENWSTLTDKKLKDYKDSDLYDNINSSKTDTMHRKYLKYILGLPKSSPNLAIYGETGETPLSLKGFRLMLNYWKRLITLPNDSLAKIAYIENVSLRTNWLQTIEKLNRTFKLVDVTNKTFTQTAKGNIDVYFKNSWKHEIGNTDSPRLSIYKVINNDFTTAKHLDLPFYLRKVVSKIRCSSHALEIEKGRHTGSPREDRICRNCQNGTIENEEHFLINCLTYQPLRDHFRLHFSNISQMSCHTSNNIRILWGIQRKNNE